MSVVVGFGPEARGRGGLELARQMAHSAGLPLVVCCVVPDRWQVPTPDAAYAAHLRGLAAGALHTAREVLAEQDGTEPGVEYVVRTGRSVPRTLLDEARARSAAMLVLGSSRNGAWGHVALGSVTARLMHSADLPLAIAPRGFRSAAGHRVQRVSVGLDGTPESVALARDAATAATSVGAGLRFLTFAVRGRTMFPPELGLHVEDDVVAAWREQAEAAQEVVVRALADGGLTPPDERLVVEGPGWAEAIASAGWRPGDVLVVGSSAEGAVARVFLGSTAARIVRYSPVPVVVAPRRRGGTRDILGSGGQGVPL